MKTKVPQVGFYVDWVLGSANFIVCSDFSSGLTLKTGKDGWAERQQSRTSVCLGRLRGFYLGEWHQVFLAKISLGTEQAVDGASWCREEVAEYNEPREREEGTPHFQN